jgi:hypothetical protein
MRRRRARSGKTAERALPDATRVSREPRSAAPSEARRARKARERSQDDRAGRVGKPTTQRAAPLAIGRQSRWTIAALRRQRLRVMLSRVGYVDLHAPALAQGVGNAGGTTRDKVHPQRRHAIVRKLVDNQLGTGG